MFWASFNIKLGKAEALKGTEWVRAVLNVPSELGLGFGGVV